MSPSTPLHYKLIGFPLNDTLISYIHDRLFQLSRMNSIYDLYELSRHGFQETISDLMKNGGLSVTEPYKQEIIKHLDKIDEKARLYNAVNTVDCGVENIGYNTECYGFLKGLPDMGKHLRGRSVLILGVREYAKIAAIEMILAGAKITLAARTQFFDQAELLQESLMNVDATAHIQVVNIGKVSGHYDLIINTTPIGMFPHVAQCPIDIETVKHASFVYDLISNPVETKLLQLAKAHSIPCSNGVPMLVWQAVSAHCIWYDASFSEEEINRLIDEVQQLIISGFSKKPSERATQS